MEWVRHLTLQLRCIPIVALEANYGANEIPVGGRERGCGQLPSTDRYDNTKCRAARYEGRKDATGLDGPWDAESQPG